MKTERWFKVLVLGGAILGEACGTPQEARPNRRGAGSGGSSAGSGGVGSPSDGAAGTSGNTAASGGSSLSGAGGVDGSAAGGAHPSGSAGERPSGSGGSGAAGSGAAGSGESGSGGAAGAAGLGGSGGQLECKVDASGHGDSRDPCGCPCCWAKDCPNTEPCCGGFCRAGDEGRGCCAP